MTRSKSPEEDSPTAADRRAYDALCREWSWARAGRELGGHQGSINIAHAVLDRHVLAGHGNSTALVELSLERRREVTYAELQVLTNQFANVLRGLGIGPGDRVFALLGRQLELHITALGSLKATAVFSPLFSSFGPEPVRARLELGAARVLVTTNRLYERKVRAIQSALPHLEHVLIVDESTGTEDRSKEKNRESFWELLESAPNVFQAPPTAAETPALLHFTSGTTGNPKGALHVHEAVVAHYATAKVALGLRATDVYWCTADPGWVTGISYGLIAPLAVGATSIIDREEFDAHRWCNILESERVNVWYTAPTAIRMLKRLGAEISANRTYSSLRHLASVGEPLEPEAVNWAETAFGRPFHDTWWQTETGAIMLANFPSLEIRPGSMGRPVPGIEAALVRRTEDTVEVVEEAGEVGELALKSGWPSMFRSYLEESERYEDVFRDGWYLSGDLARCDGEGFFWFVGRVDDAIQSAGHLIGPCEVERILLEHPSVVDAAAFGKPDPIAFEVVTAAVVLGEGVAAGDALRAELLAHARRRLGPAVAPREISFRTELPKTPSGKIIRRALREAAS